MNFISSIRDFLACRKGSYGMVLALLAPILLGLIGGVTDVVIFQNHQSELQDTADVAVLAAVEEAGLKGWSTDFATQVVAAVVAGNLTNKFSGGATYAYDVDVSKPDRMVQVTLTQDHYGYFFLGYFTGSPQIAVTATARASGQATICIIVRSPKESEVFELSGKSKLTANGCSAYSNSTSSKGINVKDTSMLTTQLVCSAGGYTGKATGYSPLPLSDCPTISDPLETRARIIDAEFGKTACTFKKMKVKAVTKTLSPGTYCDGLEITDAAKVHFNPGVYVIKDGRLKIDKKSIVDGVSVGFVFMGDKAILEFKNDSTISLSAPETGSMAGMLIYAQPAVKKGGLGGLLEALLSKGRDFKIESKDAQKLIGTVYLPVDNLVIGGDGDGDGACDPILADDGTTTPAGPTCLSDVGAASAWTAIVAKEVKITAGSSLVINSDYSGSTVPVPQGLGPTSGKLRLVD